MLCKVGAKIDGSIRYILSRKQARRLLSNLESTFASIPAALGLTALGVAALAAVIMAVVALLVPPTAPAEDRYHSIRGIPVPAELYLRLLSIQGMVSPLERQALSQRSLNRAGLAAMAAQRLAPGGEIATNPPFVRFRDEFRFFSWSRPSILRVAGLGVMPGYGDLTFRPDRPVEPAGLVAVAQRLEFLRGIGPMQGRLVSGLTRDMTPLTAAGLSKPQDSSRAAAWEAVLALASLSGWDTTVEPMAGLSLSPQGGGSRPPLLTRAEFYRERLAERQDRAGILPPLRPDGPDRIGILGYYPVDWPGDRRAMEALRQYSRHLDSVGAFLFTVDGSGAIKGRTDDELMAYARERGIKVYAVVHNYHDGGFDRELVRQLIREESRDTFIDHLLQILRRGYAGVNLDLENVPPDAREGYTALVAGLTQALHREGFAVTLAVPAKTGDDPDHGWSGGFDYPALGKLADQIVIMAYDQHWAGGPPGPIAARDWVESVLAYATRVIPGPKILLGLAAYGYDWTEGRQAKVLSATQARAGAAAAGAEVRWREGAHVPYYRYQAEGDEHTVYFEDQASTAHKASLARDYGVGGVAVWRLGLEDPGIWPLIDGLY